MKTGLCGKQRPAARSGVAPGTVRATVLPVYHYSRFKAIGRFHQSSLRDGTESTVRARITMTASIGYVDWRTTTVRTELRTANPENFDRR